MKHIWKYLLSAAATLFLRLSFLLSGGGGSAGKEELWIYLLAAGGFSILLPCFVCVCIHYILYLQKKIERYEESKN